MQGPIGIVMIINYHPIRISNDKYAGIVITCPIRILGSFAAIPIRVRLCCCCSLGLGPGTFCGVDPSAGIPQILVNVLQPSFGRVNARHHLIRLQFGQGDGHELLDLSVLLLHGINMLIEACHLRCVSNLFLRWANGYPTSSKTVFVNVVYSAYQWPYLFETHKHMFFFLMPDWAPVHQSCARYSRLSVRRSEVVGQASPWPLAHPFRSQ